MNRLTVTIQSSYKFWNSQTDALRESLIRMYGRNVEINIVVENGHLDWRDGEWSHERSQLARLNVNDSYGLVIDDREGTETKRLIVTAEQFNEIAAVVVRD